MCVRACVCGCFYVCREGGAFPVVELSLAAPVTHTARITHTLTDAATGHKVAQWEPPQPGVTHTPDPAEVQQPCMAFQQVRVWV